MVTQPATSSPAWPAQLISELDTSDQRAKELIAGLTAEQLNWHPTAGAWSIGQCLEHLCITNEIYVPAVASAVTSKAGPAVEEITPGWFGRWFIRSFIEPSPVTRRASAPRKIVPSSTVELSVLERFLRGNLDVRQLISDTSGCDVNRIRFANPFVPLLRFTVGTGLKIICGHQRRHLLQAERVKQFSGFPR